MCDERRGAPPALLRGEDPMSAVRRFEAVGFVLSALLALLPEPAPAQALSDVFERVQRAVVTVRTTEREPGAGVARNTVSISDQGSGVLLSSDG